MKDKRNLLLILFAVSVNRTIGLFPVDYIDPFPFYDIRYNGENVGISIQSYMYFLSVHLTILAIWTFLIREWELMSKLFHAFFVIEMFSLFDYFLIYEKAWFMIGGYPVEFTDIKIILYAYFIITWKQHKS